MKYPKAQLCNLHVHYFSNKTVHLPNGATFPSIHCCSCSLRENLLLDPVLYAPNFHYNLLLISELMKDLGIIVIFLPNMVGLEDFSSGKTVGIDSLHSGLYTLKVIWFANSPSVPDLVFGSHAIIVCTTPTHTHKCVTISARTDVGLWHHFSVTFHSIK